VKNAFDEQLRNRLSCLRFLTNIFVARKKKLVIEARLLNSIGNGEKSGEKSEKMNGKVCESRFIVAVAS